MKRIILLMALLFFISSAFAFTDTSAESGLPVIGAVEMLTLVKEKLQFPARIDTGAQTSSLSAVGIQPFERDGKRWLRFQVQGSGTGKLVQLEMALERTAKIKRHGALATERPVVSMVVSIGAIKQKCEFSLVDRSDYEYPALIGRNFLNGKAVVDVSHEYLVHPFKEGNTNANRRYRFLNQFCYQFQ